MKFSKVIINSYPSGTHIHAKFDSVDIMPNKSGKMVQYAKDYSWSFANLVYELPNNTTLYLSV